MAKTLKEKKQDKIAKVMGEKKLHIGKSNKLVTNPKQRIAIALSEALKVGKKKK